MLMLGTERWELSMPLMSVYYGAERRLRGGGVERGLELAVV